MTFRLGLFTIAIAIAGVVPFDAWAQCEINDHACEKFRRAEVDRKAAARRAKIRRPRKTATKRAAAAPDERQPIAAAAITTSSFQANVTSLKPPAALTRLQPGAISQAPAKLSNLQFRASDQFELVTAKCNPIERSKRRISCMLATHRLAMTSEAGAGCTGSLDLRKMEFARSEEGGWFNEDSIALCGGRLLRRTEMFPVAVDGQPQYALRETYQMLGGDSICAAPYLRSRQPLRKAYLPTGAQRASVLQCGVVASR